MKDKRKYVRMSTVFPVEIEIFTAGGEKSSSHLLQGFTRDVSSGGMCVEMKSFGKNTERLFFVEDSAVDLTINPTFSIKPVKARGRIAWLRKEDESARYLLGVAYTEIDLKDRYRILGFAHSLVWIPRISAAVAVGLICAMTLLFTQSQRLIHENKSLVRRLVQSAEKKAEVASNLEDLARRKAELYEALRTARLQIKASERLIASLSAENTQQIRMYESEIRANLAKQKDISSKLQDLQVGRRALQKRFESLTRAEAVDAHERLRQMTAWLSTHQNAFTGLLNSYEGDASLDSWAFTYDQALACQVFLLAGDLRRAEAVLRFYDERARKEDGVFFNAYNSIDGHPIENTVHTGPNIWIGIAALQYESAVKDGRYLPLARSLGDWVVVKQDDEGGIRGGPGLTWYSTEHNLDVYAFLGMLFDVTGDEKYRAAQEKVLDWLEKYAYSLGEKRMNRGKGDATISTDTFSWAIAAVGPAVLAARSLDPEAIMDFAEKNCRVAVTYMKPDGQSAKAEGFDFAKASHIGRGGIISTEWTAQMIVAYKMMADYFAGMGEESKETLYRDKAEFYLNELQKLMITSPSRTGQGRGCLPYASIDNVDTGHGWRTPKGRATGSVAGTAYGIFAWEGYNPFSLKNHPEADD